MTELPENPHDLATVCDVGTLNAQLNLPHPHLYAIGLASPDGNAATMALTDPGGVILAWDCAGDVEQPPCGPLRLLDHPTFSDDNVDRWWALRVAVTPWLGTRLGFRWWGSSLSPAVTAAWLLARFGSTTPATDRHRLEQTPVLVAAAPLAIDEVTDHLQRAARNPSGPQVPPAKLQAAAAAGIDSDLLQAKAGSDPRQHGL